MLSPAAKLTLRLQPVIVIYTLVSICSKMASRQLPAFERQAPRAYLLECLGNWRLLGLLSAMVVLLGVYAFIWQRVITNGKIAVVYANKATSIFWGQLAAVTLFGERLGVFNLLGILLIFGGVLLNNSDQRQA